jgi:hypothetical protein
VLLEGIDLQAGRRRTRYSRPAASGLAEPAEKSAGGPHLFVVFVR